MATYSPEQLGIKAPSGGFQQGGWYNGRQYWGGTLSDPGVIHESSNQVGAGQAVSKEVNAQSAQAQGVSAPQFESYLEMQRRNAATAGGGAGAGSGAAYAGGGSGASGSGAGFSGQAELNIPSLYENLYKDAGISDIEAQLSDQEKQMIETKSKINDNPFLSEATRVGRVAKLEQLYNERTASLRNDIATKKADIETKLNLEMKQFDINSQAAQQALNQFNTLLQMGALDNASGEDIANITRSTGISSQAIYSAIQTNKQNNVKTSMQTIDDGKTISAVVINTQTGEIISRTPLGSSKPSAGSKPTQAQQEYERQSYYNDKAREMAAGGYDLDVIFGQLGDKIDPNQLYLLYQNNSMFGPDNTSPAELERRFGVTLKNQNQTGGYGY